MTATDFNRWLAEMKAAKLATTNTACAKLLGLSANTIVSMKERGADRRTALACRALLHHMEPYGSEVE